MKIVKYIPCSLIDYPKHLASVCFTLGCNYRCWYCHNTTILDSQQDKTQDFLAFLRARVGMLDGVVICGGEPTIHKDLVEFIKNIKNLGFDVKLDTNGTNPKMLKELIDGGLLDYIAMDIKAPIDKYEQITQLQPRIDTITESIEIIKNCKVEYEFRSTISPDLSLEDMRKMANLIKGAKKYYLQPYLKPNHLKDAPEPHKIETLENAVEELNKIVNTVLRV